jgi:nitrous oxidase accessory protein
MFVLFTVLACAAATVIVILALFHSQLAAAAADSVPVPGGNTIIVDAHSTQNSIGKAIRAAQAGDTILVYSGIYYERLVIDKALTIRGVDTGWGLPVIDGMRQGDVVTIPASGVRIEGLVVKGSGDTGIGIHLLAGGNTVAGCEVTGCYEGIDLDAPDGGTASGNVISGDHVHDNAADGVTITGGSGDVVAGNHANDNSYGIWVVDSTGCIIENNNCSNNIDIEIYLENVTDCIVRNNTMTSERIKDKKIDGLGMRFGTNVTFDSNYVSRHYYGIKVYNSNDCLVENNVADGSGVNIRLDFGTYDTTLLNNTVRNGVDNVYLHSNATGNIVENNTCYNGREGIYLLESPGNTVRGNEVYYNNIGIRLVSTTDNTITGNYAHDNDDNILADGGSNTIAGNDERPKPPTPTPTATQMPTRTAQAGNSIIDFITSIFQAIFG